MALDSVEVIQVKLTVSGEMVVVEGVDCGVGVMGEMEGMLVGWMELGEMVVMVEMLE